FPRFWSSSLGGLAGGLRAILLVNGAFLLAYHCSSFDVVIYSSYCFNYSYDYPYETIKTTTYTTHWLSPYPVLLVFLPSSADHPSTEGPYCAGEASIESRHGE